MRCVNAFERRDPATQKPQSRCGDRVLVFGSGVSVIAYTLTYQNLLFCRVPINSILGCIIRTYKKVGFGRLR